MMLNKQQGYLPPLLVSILLVIQANYLSGHRSRHTDIESDDNKPNPNIGLAKDKNKHWTEKWETSYYRNGEKGDWKGNPSKNLAYYEGMVKWDLNDEGKNRKYM